MNHEFSTYVAYYPIESFLFILSLFLLIKSFYSYKRGISLAVVLAIPSLGFVGIVVAIYYVIKMIDTGDPRNALSRLNDAYLFGQAWFVLSIVALVTWGLRLICVKSTQRHGYDQQ